MICPSCPHPAVRTRTLAGPVAGQWTHHYSCPGGHRFTTTELVTGKPACDRRQLGRLLDQLGTFTDELRRVLGYGR